MRVQVAGYFGPVDEGAVSERGRGTMSRRRGAAEVIRVPSEVSIAADEGTRW